MHKVTIFSLTVLALTLATGCQTYDISKASLPWSTDKDAPKKSKYEPPAKMVAVWKDSVYYSAAGQPTRGFGGRLYFYNQKGQAIPVEGQLAVYGYDDTGLEGAPPQNRPPERRFAFTQEQFSKHFSETDLGASYSVWIPWDAAGGEQRHISLLPVFTTVDGKVTVGQQTANVLPGTTKDLPPPQEELPQPYYEGSAVSFEQPSARTSTQLKTTTINIPRSGAINGLNTQRPQTIPPEAMHSHPSESGPEGYSPRPTWQPSYARPMSWQDGRSTSLNQRPVGSLPPQAWEEPLTGQQPGDPPATHYEPTRSRALGGPIARLGRDRGPTPRFPAGQLSGHPGRPQPGPSIATQGFSASGQPTGW
jgi:hypothetical protein